MKQKTILGSVFVMLLIGYGSTAFANGCGYFERKVDGFGMGDTLQDAHSDCLVRTVQMAWDAFPSEGGHSICDYVDSNCQVYLISCEQPADCKFSDELSAVVCAGKAQALCTGR